MDISTLKQEILSIGKEGCDRGFEAGVESCKSVIRMVFPDAMSAEKLCDMIDQANSFKEDA